MTTLAVVPPLKHPSVLFLTTLYAGQTSVLELHTFGPDGDDEAARALRREANHLRDFVPVKNGVVDEERVTRFIDGCNAAHLGAFFGVALRSQISLKTRKGDAKHCQTLTTLFVDADYKHLGEDDTISRINACPLPPSMVVESGGGLHPYWILKHPFFLKHEMKDAKRWLRHIAASVADVVDESVSEPARVLRLPGSYNFKKEYDPPRLVTLSLHTDRVYSLDEIGAAFGEPTEPENVETSGFKVPDTISKGDRHSTIYRFLRSQKARDVPLDVALAGCHALNKTKCDPPIAAKELDDYLRRVWDQENEPGFDRNKKSRAFPYTEAGDAEFFAAKHADNVRFDHARRRWLHFDENRWRPDEKGSILTLALAVMRDRQRLALNIHGDDDARRRNLKWTISGESKNRLKNLLDIAQSLKPLADDGTDWDTKPFILCAPNGVIDLHTGTLRPGHPDDRITNCTSAEYHPDATSELWRSTLAAIFENSTPMMDYWQRFIGYALSGTAQEEVFPLLWGGGRNGKGTIIESLRSTLGDYADDLPFASLEKNARGAISNDMAKLPGKRFVTASETEGGVRLNEPRLKQLTGRDPVTCRFLHREFFTFAPMFVLFLATNEKPEIRDYSDGFWERVHLVPFTHQFLDADRDPTVKTRLKGDPEQLQALLAWAVQGCLLWQKEGLNPPPEVLEATQEYREDSQPLTAFLEDRCVVGNGDDHRTTFKVLWSAYQQWAGRNAALNRRTFIDALKKKFSSNSAGRKVMYSGVALRDDRLFDGSTDRDGEAGNWTDGVPPVETQETEEM